MSYLDDLYSEKRRYEVLKSDVSSVVGKLSEIASDLDMPKTNLDNSFRIDNTSLGANKLNSIKNSLLSRADCLSNNVVSSINGEISSINSKISAEENRIQREREEEERRKQERLEAEAKEEAAKQEDTNSGSK